MTASTVEPAAGPVKIAPPRPQAWWTPNVERARVQRLLRTKDLPGLMFLIAWVAMLAATTWALAATWGTLLVVPSLLVHGIVLSFSYAISHETAHGTAFRSKWLNESVFYFTSFIFGEEPMYRRFSHGRHHAATWYPGFDSQMPYQNPITRTAYARETLAISGMFAGLVQMIRHTRGKLTRDEREFVPRSRVRQLIWGARLFLLGYAGMFVVAALTQSIFLPVAFFGARIAGGWVVQLFINSQHMCMSEAVSDHRHSTRSLACSWPVRLLYWNMNFHIEHHLYPGVPFHALPAINRLVRNELPQPTRGALRANLEILEVIGRQSRDPTAVATPRFQT
ncbi:MAG: fatty acid desaturase [Gammaproteobacteria bacterium]